MPDKNGIERTYANKGEYDWEGGEVFEEPEDEPQLYNFKVNVKWTGTIASFDIVAETEQEAVLVANKKLDMESNGLIHFDTEKME
tara:strand:- start:1184 stop:1438 length:255 start_codon:yes stop_codon:yes gene_type:complete